MTNQESHHNDDILHAQHKNIVHRTLPLPQTGRDNFFRWFLAGVAVLVIALCIALYAFVTLPQNPPTDWIASYSSTNVLGGRVTAIYYMHWDNQNGDLTGNMQTTTYAGGAPISIDLTLTGAYQSQDHQVFLTLSAYGRSEQFSGVITDNDTMTLIQVNTNQQGRIVFFPGKSNDYQQTVQSLDHANQ